MPPGETCQSPPGFIHSLIHSFTKYSSSPCPGPGSMLGTGDAAINKTKFLPAGSLEPRVGRDSTHSIPQLFTEAEAVRPLGGSSGSGAGEGAGELSC